MLGYWEEALKNQETDESANVFSFKDKIELKDVSFAYNKDASVLKNLNLEIKAIVCKYFL